MVNVDSQWRVVTDNSRNLKMKLVTQEIKVFLPLVVPVSCDDWIRMTKYYNKLISFYKTKTKDQKNIVALLQRQLIKKINPKILLLPVVSSRLKSMRSSADTVDTKGSQVGYKGIPSKEYRLKKKHLKCLFSQHPRK